MPLFIEKAQGLNKKLMARLDCLYLKKKRYRRKVTMLLLLYCSGWDGVNFLHSSLCGAVFWICNCCSFDKTVVFHLLLRCACTVSEIFFSHSAPARE